MEDSLYKCSSQYLRWTFTPESLSTVRTATNAAASAQVKAAIQRARDRKKRKKVAGGDIFGGALDTPGAESDGSLGGASEEKEIECLTADEELKLVRYYCKMIMEIATVFEFPTNVKATAPTFLRRFFTRTSPMTYHPKTVVATILYLTTKTENHYISLNAFSAKIPKSTPEEILAPEFVVAMGLRWCFEVKHPFRGLEGAIMELVKVCDGNYHPPPPLPSQQQQQDQQQQQQQPPSAQEWQTRLHALPPLTPPTSPKARIERAHGKSRAILSSSALLTDAYFLFTPPQIYLAALYLVDPALTLFFIDLKLSYPDTPEQHTTKEALIDTVQRCADVLKTGGEPGAPFSKEELDEVTRIDRKLYFCRNPEKVDLVSANKLAKRGVTDDQDESGNGGGAVGAGSGSNGAGDNGSGVSGGSAGGAANNENEKREREVKKRKLEREKISKEGDDLFGAPLQSSRLK
ncbi:cyclin-like protein [Peziza echinospora]|nr:cyclin-like protein [Peziza echinospora]